MIDLGDRVFEVVHLPGHTPGSAGLIDRDSGVLFTGDVLYDGDLLDELPESNIDDYVAVHGPAAHAGRDGGLRRPRAATQPVMTCSGWARRICRSARADRLERVDDRLHLAE